MTGVLIYIAIVAGAITLIALATLSLEGVLLHA